MNESKFIIQLNPVLITIMIMHHSQKEHQDSGAEENLQIYSPSHQQKNKIKTKKIPSNSQ